MPLVDHLCALFGIAARTYGQGDALVVERDRGLGLLVLNRHQVSPSPEVVTFALDELARSLPRLLSQFVLLLPNPGQFRDCIGSGDVEARSGWGGQGHPAIRWMNRKMDILDILSRDHDSHISEFDRLVHQ